MKKTISKTLFLAPMVAVAFTTAAYAAAPGITGTGTSGTFNLIAQTAFLNQPDGAGVYAWGYGCTTGSTPTFVPAPIAGAACPAMQVPGPTLVVTEGQAVTVNLTNGLPTAAGNTSILFPGFNVTSTGGVPGLLTQEALPGGSVTYTFTAGSPGTRAYYSGTQGDLQVEMGLYGAVIVLPAHVPANCTSTTVTGFYGVKNAGAPTAETDFRLSTAAYDHPGSCYDREYLFQFAEMDVNIHRAALAQVTATINSGVCATAGAAGCSLNVATEPYRSSYFLINGRSMPDDMDANYGAEYPHQPYNGNPHMHPGEQVLIRVIGQGRLQHPFHEHGNHVRILGRDGNLILSNSTITYSGASAPALAGPLLFTTTTTPGLAFDGIFYFTGRGLNWDAYGHHGPVQGPQTNPNLAQTTLAGGINATQTTITVANATGITVGALLSVGTGATQENMRVVTVVGNTLTVTRATDGSVVAVAHASGASITVPNPNFNPNGNTSTVTANDELPCVPDANGYYTVLSGAPASAINYYEWCADHNKPLQANPFGDVASGGPATLPDPNIFTNGVWYGGSPYLGPDANIRATGPNSSQQPANIQGNPANERGWAFMWHSHNEREITTNNVFPGGMLMMMLVDSREFVIDEAN